jgi:hypothetical protein
MPSSVVVFGVSPSAFPLRTRQKFVGPVINNGHVIFSDLRAGADLDDFAVTQSLHGLAECRVVLPVFVVKLERFPDLNQHPIAILFLIELQEPCTVLKIYVTSAAFAFFLAHGVALAD